MTENTLTYLAEKRTFFEDRKIALMFWDGEAPQNYAGNLSYSALANRSSRFASLLRSLNVARGDRVALMLPNCPQFVVAYFAILKMGAIAVPVNPLYENDPGTLYALLKDSGARVIVAWDLFFGKLAKLKDDIGLKKIIVTGPADALPWGKAKIYIYRTRKRGEWVDYPKNDGFTVSYSEYSRAGVFPGDVTVRPRDSAVILYTSGTSGEPKGVLHTHETMLANAHSCRDLVYELGMEDGKEIFLAAAPYFHIMGLTSMLHLPLLMRGKIILLPKPGEISKLLDAIDKARPTGFVGFPKLYDAINLKLKKDGAGRHDLTSLKVCISGAAHLSNDTKDRFRNFSSRDILTGYGSTEAGITHCQRTAKDGGVGKLLNGVYEKIYDADPEGEGELCIFSKSLMLGYWKKPAETNRIFDADGWFMTGDMVKKNADGCILITGRASEDFVKGSHGEKIPLGSSEKILKEHPKVGDAAVVAISRSGDKFLLRAFVAFSDPETSLGPEIEDELYSMLKVLPANQISDEIVSIKEIPKSPMGKVLKKVLRASS